MFYFLLIIFKLLRICQVPRNCRSGFPSKVNNACLCLDSVSLCVPKAGLELTILPLPTKCQGYMNMSHVCVTHSSIFSFKVLSFLSLSSGILNMFGIFNIVCWVIEECAFLFSF